jgi:ATPase family protein associated with various cellular activities (AAA)
MHEFPSRITLAQELHDPTHSVSIGFFVDRALSTGLKELRFEGWPTREHSLAALGEPLFHAQTEAYENAVFEENGVLFLVNRGGSFINVSAAAADSAALDQALKSLRERFPLPDPSSSNDVPVTFWTYTPHGPQPSWRAIGVPSWDDIRDNYSSSTKQALGELMRDFQPAHGGQLILWHGAAGTGKTFALRALAWEWREWCQLHYIVDPDSFFGEHADYLMSVLLQEGPPMMISHRGVVPMMGYSAMQFVEDGDGGDDEGQQAWRILVLEDTGELLAADARDVMGQALSRFLNVVDGLIGQGLRILVLVTTNEEVRTLHPAVARPGRCAADIDFTPLSGEEASKWLHRHSLEDGRAEPRTLASLYAQVEGREPSLATFGPTT